MGDSLGIWDTVRSAFAASGETEVKSQPTVTFLGTASADFWPQDGDRPLDEIAEANMRRALAASYVLYAILHYRAQKLVEAPPVVVVDTEDGDQRVDHELDALFRNPNPDEDWHELATVTQMLVDLDGRCLWVKTRDNAGRVRRVRAYHHGEFSVERGRDATGDMRVYGRFSVNHFGRSESYGPEDVVFFRTPHPYNRYETLCPTDAVLGMLGIAGEMHTRVKAMVRNAAVPSGFFVSPPEAGIMGDEQFARAKSEVNQNYRSTNTGRAGLLEGGMQYIRTQMGLDEIKFGELWREVEAACCAAFSIRPEVLGFLVGLENAPWSHMQTARRLVYEDSAVPAWNFFSRALTRQLLEPAERDRGLRVDFDTSEIGVLKEDMDRMSRIARRMGADMSRNERRQLIGLDSTDNPIDDEVGATEPGALPSDDETQPPTLASAGPPEEGKSSARYAEWKAFDELAASFEPELRAAVLEELDRDLELVEELFEDELKAEGEWIETKDLSEDELRRRASDMGRRLDREYAERRADGWRASMVTLGRNIAERGARTISDRLSVRFDLVSPGATEWAERHAAESIVGIGETTRENVRREISRGIDAGESIPDIRDRLVNSSGFSESRAELIARTEATSTLNGSQRAGLSRYQEETGDRVAKEWLATQDDRTRDEHMDMDGVEVGIDENFDTEDLGPIQYPQAPNCRCTTVYRIIRGDE